MLVQLTLVPTDDRVEVNVSDRPPGLIPVKGRRRGRAVVNDD